MKFLMNLALVCGVCGPLSAFAAKETLTIGIVQEWDNFHPVSFGTAASEAMLGFIFRQMTAQDEKGNVRPELAQSIPSFKNKSAKIINQGSEKLVQATWKIRPEAKWSDATPITCEDWKFGWDVGMNSNVSKQEQNIYTKIKKIEWSPTDAKTCVVTYANDNWSFDRDLPPFLPKHVEAQVYEKWKDKSQGYEQNSNYITNPSAAGLYSGPYVIKELKIGSHIIFEANPNFWGEKPKIKTVILKHIADTNTLKPNLQTKQIDMVSAVGNPPDLAITMAKEEANSDFKVMFVDSTLFQGLFFNLENELLKQKPIREAISLAVDKKKLTTSFFESRLNPAYTIFGQKDVVFKDRSYKPDLKKANEVLEKAGWKLGKSGIREKNGKKLAIEFKTSSGIRVLELIQLSLCDDFKKIGLACEIKNEPPRIFLGESTVKGKFAMGMFGQTTLYDTSLTDLYHTRGIPNTANAWAGGNHIRLSSPELDKLLIAFDQQWDKAERVKILKKIDELISLNIWVMPLYHRREAFILPKNLKGFTASMRGTNFEKPELWTLQ